MDWLTSLNSRLSRWAMYLAVAGLFGIVIVVVGSVFGERLHLAGIAYPEAFGGPASPPDGWGRPPWA